MLFDENTDHIANRIRQRFDTINANKITIIDPYFTSIDIEFVLKCFASFPTRKIKIYTRYKEYSDLRSESNVFFKIVNRIKKIFFKKKKFISRRETQLEIASSIAKDILKKGIFTEFIIRNAKIDFHDRYILCEDEIDKDIFLFIGSSINTIGKGYSYLYKIGNYSFKRQILKLIQILDEKSDDVC